MSEFVTEDATIWTLVVAMDRKGVIGNGSDLPWRLSSDLRRFKAMTMGHCLLMGRKTFDSIGRILPGRQTIVLSRRGMASPPEGLTVVSSVDQVNDHVEPGRQVMVVGGAEIYASLLPFCRQLWVTRVEADVEGDVIFPKIDWAEWELLETEAVSAGPKDEWATEFQRWARRS